MVTPGAATRQQSTIAGAEGAGLLPPAKEAPGHACAWGLLHGRSGGGHAGRRRTRASVPPSLLSQKMHDFLR